MLKSDLFKVRKFSGGTLSDCFQVTLTGYGSIVFKNNEVTILKDEIEFLKNYCDLKIIPNFLFNFPNYSTIVYEFIEGEAKKEIDNKRVYLKYIVDNLLSNYLKNKNLVWGKISDPSITWKKYLKILKKESQLQFNDFIYSVYLDIYIDNVIDDISLFNENRGSYLLHGDLGFYNILFLNDEISGIIDPMPIYGPPIYDLVFAFLSTCEDIEDIFILEIMNLLDFNSSFTTEYKIKEILFGLYFRMGRCLKHHPKDIYKYLSAFEFWQEQLRIIAT